MVKETTCRVNLSASTRRRLWSESGGYCGNPRCRQYLFPDELDIDFGELAHVIPASTGGPRDVPLDEVSLEERAHHSNVILLCANCHTVADKAPGAFPADMLRQWKQTRVDEIRTAVATPVFQTRSAARAHIQPWFDVNRSVHSRYAPVGDPYRDGNPALWLRHARATIIPNNRKILEVLDANRRLLTRDEQETVARFRLHVQQFEARYVLDDFTAGTERFPVEMETSLLDQRGASLA